MPNIIVSYKIKWSLKDKVLLSGILKKEWFERMKVALIFAVVAVAANVLLIWYAKKKYCKADADESSNPNNTGGAFSHGYLNTPEAKRLRKAVADELGISVQELDRMSAEDVRQLAKEQELINTG